MEDSFKDSLTESPGGAKRSRGQEFYEMLEATYAGASFLVDPFRITDYERSDHALELFACFAIAVAGKMAKVWNLKVERFFEECGHTGSPFERIAAMEAEGSLRANMERVRLGKYDLMTRGYPQLAAFGASWLRTASPDELEAVHGISNKTSRFIVLHSRRDARIAVIDTHMLKYLRAIDAERVPDTIPNGADYLRLQDIVVAEADRLNMGVAEFDLKVWTWFEARNTGIPDFARPPAGPGQRAAMRVARVGRWQAKDVAEAA